MKKKRQKDSICYVKTCNEPAKSRGLCMVHFVRILRDDTPIPRRKSGKRKKRNAVNTNGNGTGTNHVGTNHVGTVYTRTDKRPSSGQMNLLTTWALEMPEAMKWKCLDAVAKLDESSAKHVISRVIEGGQGKREAMEEITKQMEARK